MYLISIREGNFIRVLNGTGCDHAQGSQSDLRLKSKFQIILKWLNCITNVHKNDAEENTKFIGASLS